MRDEVLAGHTAQGLQSICHIKCIVHALRKAVEGASIHYAPAQPCLPSDITYCLTLNPFWLKSNPNYVKS